MTQSNKHIRANLLCRVSSCEVRFEMLEPISSTLFFISALDTFVPAGPLGPRVVGAGAREFVVVVAVGLVLDIVVELRVELVATGFTPVVTVPILPRLGFVFSLSGGVRVVLVPLEVVPRTPDLTPIVLVLVLVVLLLVVAL